MRVVPLIAVAASVWAASANAEPREVTKVTGTQIAAAIVATWKCQDNLGIQRSEVRRNPWALKHHTREYAIGFLNLWKVRHNECRTALKEKRRQWNWQAFPSWIIELARCESSINWFAEGSSSHGTFYSAFNISRSVYDRDAHHMGVRGWNEGPGVPSPYEQAMAVIGHMRLYGDGFTGRCHGIARSSWNG